MTRPGQFDDMSLTARRASKAFRATGVTIALGAALLVLPALAAEPAPTPTESSPAASASSGQGAFNNHCRTCHTVKAGDNRLGPSLNGIIGKKSGASSGYPNYSQAMKTAGVVWDEATLDRFIADPEAVVPNNNMKPFKGIPDAAVRKAIVEYVKKS